MLRSLGVTSWLLRLFNPPPLSSLSFWQKIGRIFGVSLTLFASCVLTALALAAAIFTIDRGWTEINVYPELLRGLEIVVASLGVNVLCVAIVLEIKKADLRPHLPSSESLGLH